mmetsp:Transcript_21072/g.51901  ORF Transcript_21072/g.51901 Transcript_21072/m.51901 type:complete len:157 (+) Transcript_21072:214-684(+)
MLQGEASKLYSIKPTSDIDLSDVALADAWGRVRNGEPSWAVFSYAPNSRTRIAVRALGDTIDDMIAQLDAQSVSYAAFSVNLAAGRKLVFLTHVGPSVGAMLRGKAAMHRQDMESFCDGTVGAIHVDGEDSFSPADLKGRVQDLLGSDITFLGRGV